MFKSAALLLSALMIAPVLAPAVDPVVPASPKPVAPWPPSVVASCAHPVATIAKWPLRRRVGQLVMVGVPANDPLLRRDWVTKEGVGGVLIAGIAASGPKLASDLSAVKALDPWVAPLIAVDEEGGRVQLLRKVTGLVPSARRLGRMTPDHIRTLISAHSKEVRALGIDMVFGPVLDVTASTKGVIGDRSFGGDRGVVAASGIAYAQGLIDSGLIPVIKHFPGHGSADGDSHTGRVQTPSADTVIAEDAQPFRDVMAAVPVAVMVAHVEVPGLTGSRPASVSRRAITWLLRIKFGFHGLIVSDSLTMGAVNLRWPPSRAAVESIKAGADIAILATVTEVTSILDALVAAVSDHTIDEGQLNRSVLRVLRTKGVNPCAVSNPRPTPVSTPVSNPVTTSPDR
jgi:beta-N-acetylhexosaminidase